jgi:hypothetical protein
MLNPNRLCGSWFARKKTVKWEFERRLPVRYTASNSPRRTNRDSRGNSRPRGLLGREPMASLLAACCKHLAPTYRLHAYAESVRLGASALPRLICSLWQSNPPCFPSNSWRFAAACLPCTTPRALTQFRFTADGLAVPCCGRSLKAVIRSESAARYKHTPTTVSESVSVVDPRVPGQENRG